jgi:AbrB family looped-hinge helix DNA binding protein
MINASAVISNPEIYLTHFAWSLTTKEYTRRLMSESTVTSKGQITIPVDVRAFLSLRTGERVVFNTLEDSTVRMRAKNRTIRDLEGSLSDSNPTNTKVSIEDMSIGQEK